MSLGFKILEKLVVDEEFIDEAALEKYQRKNRMKLAAGVAIITVSLLTGAFVKMRYFPDDKGNAAIQMASKQEKVQQITEDQFNEKGYEIAIPTDSTNVSYAVVTAGDQEYGQINCKVGDEDYQYRVSNDSKDLDIHSFAGADMGEAAKAAKVNDLDAKYVVAENGSGVIYWSTEDKESVYAVRMEKGASKDKLVKAAQPLENHAQVHDVAVEMKASLIYGLWKYDDYDSYIEILEDGTFYYLGSDKKRETAYPYKIMKDCIILYNETGGEDTVLYYTKDGKLVDAGGDGLTKEEGNL